MGRVRGERDRGSGDTGTGVSGDRDKGQGRQGDRCQGKQGQGIRRDRGTASRGYKKFSEGCNSQIWKHPQIT